MEHFEICRLKRSGQAYLANVKILLTQFTFSQGTIYSKKLNPWRYSPEEPRPTEVVAARWQYMGHCGQKSVYPSNFSFLNRISLLLIKQLPNCPHEDGWTPFQTLYLQKNFQGIAEHRTRDLLDGSYSRGLKFLQCIYGSFDCDLSQGFLFMISINK